MSHCTTDAAMVVLPSEVSSSRRAGLASLPLRASGILLLLVSAEPEGPLAVRPVWAPLDRAMEGLLSTRAYLLADVRTADGES